MRQFAIGLALLGLLGGCGSGEQYNTSPPEPVEPQVSKPKVTPKKPKIPASAQVD